MPREIRYNGWKIWRNKFRWQARHLRTDEWLPFSLDLSVDAIKRILDDPAMRRKKHAEREKYVAEAPALINKTLATASANKAVYKLGYTAEVAPIAGQSADPVE